MDGLLVWISSGSKGEVWGTNKHGDVFQREGISQSNPTGSGWKRIKNRLLEKVSIWKGQAWGVNHMDQIYSKYIYGKIFSIDSSPITLKCILNLKIG